MSMASLPRVDRTFLWWERFSTRSRVLVSWRAFKSSKVLRRRRLQYHCPWRLNLETRQVWSTSTPWTNPSWFHTKISHCLEVRNKTVNLKHNDKRTCVFKTESKSNTWYQETTNRKTVGLHAGNWLWLDAECQVSRNVKSSCALPLLRICQTHARAKPGEESK